MNEATSATDTKGSADPDGVPGDEPSPAAAAELNVEAVALFNRADTAERLKQSLRRRSKQG